MHRAAVWQHSSNSKNCPLVYWAFLVQSVWFLFWWCPLFSVDCFHKLCLSGTPSENSQAGWDLGNRMARGYQFDVKWVSPMGSYAWGIQVFYSRWWFKMRWFLISRTKHLNTSGIVSHGRDSFHVKPNTTLAILFPRSQPAWLFPEGVPVRQHLRKQSTDKRGHHQKRNHTDCTRNAQ